MFHLYRSCCHCHDIVDRCGQKSRIQILYRIICTRYRTYEIIMGHHVNNVINLIHSSSSKRLHAPENERAPKHYMSISAIGSWVEVSKLIEANYNNNHHVCLHRTQCNPQLSCRIIEFAIPKYQRNSSTPRKTQCSRPCRQSKSRRRECAHARRSKRSSIERR